MKNWIALTIIVFFFATVSQAKDDFQYWSLLTWKAVDGKVVDLNTHAQIRFKDDASETSLYFISEKLKFDFFKNLSLGVNYTRLQSRSVNAKTGSARYIYQNRYEFEANPHWTWNEKVKIQNRNRVEFREIENQGSDNTRFRHRWTLRFPKLWLYTNAEFFYDFEKDKYNENRLVPLGLDLKILKKVTLQIFYLAQSVKKDRWTTRHALGSHVIFMF